MKKQRMTFSSSVRAAEAIKPGGIWWRYIMDKDIDYQFNWENVSNWINESLDIVTTPAGLKRIYKDFPPEDQWIRAYHKRHGKHPFQQGRTRPRASNTELTELRDMIESMNSRILALEAEVTRPNVARVARFGQ